MNFHQLGFWGTLKYWAGLLGWGQRPIESPWEARQTRNKKFFVVFLAAATALNAIMLWYIYQEDSVPAAFKGTEQTLKNPAPKKQETQEAPPKKETHPPPPLTMEWGDNGADFKISGPIPFAGTRGGGTPRDSFSVSLSGQNLVLTAKPESWASGMLLEIPAGKIASAVFSASGATTPEKAKVVPYGEKSVAVTPPARAASGGTLTITIVP